MRAFDGFFISIFSFVPDLIFTWRHAAASRRMLIAGQTMVICLKQRVSSEVIHG